MNRPQAGTLRISSHIGVRIISETVKEHMDDSGAVVFRELIGFEVKELWPGAANGISVTYLSEPSNVK